MAIVRVQAPAGVTGAGAAAITLSATGAGEAIFYMCFCSGGGTPTVTDDQLNIYVVDASEVSTEGVFIASCINPTAGVTSVSGTATGGQIMIAFVGTYTGILSSGAFDKTNGLANGAGATYTSNATATLSQADELCLGMTGTGFSSSNNIAADGSWLNPQVHLGNAGDGDDARWQEQIVSATTALAATGTHTSVTRFHALIATYRGGAAAATSHLLACLGAGG